MNYIKLTVPDKTDDCSDFPLEDDNKYNINGRIVEICIKVDEIDILITRHDGNSDQRICLEGILKTTYVQKFIGAQFLTLYTQNKRTTTIAETDQGDIEVKLR